MKKISKFIFSVLVAFILTLNVNADALSDLISKNNEVVLDQNYTENVVIEKGKKVTIDLNGYTLTGDITTLGELTIKSSKEGGKVVSKKSIKVGDFEKDKDTGKITSEVVGKFTLESGTIEVTDDYGVYCMSGSTAIINGGEVTSVDSALTSNNLTGGANFVVNGGTLTSKQGPAIYLPSTGSVKITGGTINGGVSIRMGQIDISGGTINGIADNNDPLAKYYDFSGNAWLSDTVYVWGGTYTSKEEGTSNDLTLNITGGTINGKIGSAVAIYDMGLVAQNIKVNISDNAKLTGASNDSAFKVVTLEEAGITNIKSGYNNKDLVGKVNTTITGGTFSSTVAKYLENDYAEKEENNLFTVSKREVKVDTPKIDETKPVDEVTIGVKNSEDLSNIFVDSLGKTTIDFTDVSKTVVEVDVNNKKESDLAKEVLDSIKKISEESKITLSSYFDITLNIKNGENNEVLGTLDELTKKVTFAIALPEDLAKVADGYTRKYYVIRYHDGKSEILEASSDGKLITFETDKFSSYALAYEDTKTEKPAEIENPKTGDRILVSVIACTVSLAGLALCLKNKYSKKNN